MTRTTDTLVGLNRRAEIARDANADLFASIHLNAHRGAANGVETFLHTNSTASEPLARNVNNQIRSQLGRLAGRTITNRGVKKANFAVLRGTYRQMLAILPEVLFMDNRRDHEVIKHRDFVKTAAKAIADGIRQTVRNGSIVCIDPGHGGSDPGTSGFGLLEKDLNLQIGLALRTELQGGSTPDPSPPIRDDDYRWVGTDDKGKELIVDTASLNYYDTPRWTNPNGSRESGYKWKIDNLYRVNASLQYRVQDENGNLFFTSGRSDLVKVGGTYTGSAPRRRTVHLPPGAKTWRTYRLNVQPIKVNSDWSLTPGRYGGLTYEVLGEPYPNVVTIQTDRGRRNIYVGPGTGATIK